MSPFRIEIHARADSDAPHLTESDFDRILKKLEEISTNEFRSLEDWGVEKCRVRVTRSFG